jgi:septal ring factor EnvC (AmiA/AmiB activator)
MPYNLVEAGKAIGMGKSSVLRAIRKGVISASRDPVTGGWAIEPAELHRAFPAVANGTAQNQGETIETDVMRELRARLDDTQRTTEDLRRRLDRSDEERGRLQHQLAAAQERIAALLTDQRAPAAAVTPRRWRLPWRRL